MFVPAAALLEYTPYPLAAHSFQKAVAEKLKPIEVDPEDKSWKAAFTRARNFALKGMTHDIHADIANDAKLTEVSCHSVTLLVPPARTQHKRALHLWWEKAYCSLLQTQTL